MEHCEIESFLVEGSHGEAPALVAFPLDGNRLPDAAIGRKRMAACSKVFSRATGVGAEPGGS